MKKLIAILLVLLVICGYAFAEGTISELRELTVEQQAFDAYLDIAFVYDEGVKYLEELGVLWSKVTDTDSVDDIHQLWFNTYLTGNISGTGFSRFSNLNELATVKYGYKGAEELSSYLNGLRDKTDAIWICLSLLVESGYIEDPNDLESYLDDAMEGIRSVMALDREYPFLKDLQNYYKDANYLYEYAADFNDSYVSFNEKLDEFQKNRSSWEIDFEFIYDKNADEFDYVYEVRLEEAAHERELVFARASALENNGDLEGALDLYWSIHSTEDVERCRNKLLEADSAEMEKLQEAASAKLEKDYWQAVELQENGEYAQALTLFEDLGDYKDSKERKRLCEDGITPCESVSCLYNNRCVVIRNGKYGYIDENGHPVIPCEYENAFSFTDKLAAVCKDGKWGYIDADGNLKIDYKYGFASTFEDGLACVNMNGNYGYIDLEENIVIPFEYMDARGFADGLAAVSKGTGYGYINASGEVVIDYNFLKPGTFQNGYAYALFKGEAEFNWIDHLGNVVFSEGYDNIRTIRDGIAAVQKDNKWGYVNAEDEVVIPFEYTDALGYNDGLAPVRIDNSWYVIDANNNIVLESKYRILSAVEDGLIIVTELGSSKYGVIDLDGNLIIPCAYDQLSYNDGYYVVHEGGKVSVIAIDELLPGYREEVQAKAAARVAEQEAAAERAKLLEEYTDKETVKSIQTALNEAGYPCGTSDGAAGKKTIAALTQYQTDKGLTVTGTITHETLLSMGLAS